MRPFLLAATTALSASFAFSPAHAQTVEQEPAAAEEQAGGIQDIVVTAQRRSESMQDVPIAVSAFSSDQLQSQGVSNTLELGQYVPNLVAQNNTGIGSANAYYLRGLGNTETVATFDPPVGTYVDDIYLSRQNANNLSLFDVERVEVLRGPQGTLFGRNTTGGAISVIMREPGNDFGGYAELGYGRFDKKLVRGSVDLPVVDSLSVKVSGYWQDDDGYAKNVTTGQRMNDDDGWGARLGVRGELSPSVRWNGSFTHIAADGDNVLNFECNPANPSDCKGRFITSGLREGGRAETSPYAPLVIRGRKANFLQGNHSTTDLITSNLEIDLSDDLTLNLITGNVSLSQQFAFDFFDGRSSPSLANPFPPVRAFPRGGFTILNDGQHEQFTQEAKLGGKLFDGAVDFVGGAYYIDERNRTDFADILSIFNPAVPGGVPLLLADRTLRNRTEAFAGYLQADFNVTDQLKLTAGIRYTDEKKTLKISDNRPSCNDAVREATCLDSANLVAANGTAIPSSQRAKLWTPRFAINFTPNDDILLFASATRGFKSGGWNARGTTASQLLPFGPEKVWSYEAGMKSDWFDRRLRVNLTAYYMDVSSLQTPSALVAPNGAITFITRNFADYRNKGIEAEVTLVPVEGLNLYVNGGYQDDEYRIDRDAPDFDEFGIQSVAAQQRLCLQQLATGAIPGGPGTAACAAGIVTADGSIATPVRTPKWSLALGGSYELGLGGKGMTLVPSINASYRSRSEVGTGNFSLYTGAITGSNGTFPVNPFDGDFILGSMSKAAWLFNAGLALNGPDKKWQLSVQCSNCFNQTFNQSTLANFNYLNQPMTWSVRARVNF